MLFKDHNLNIAILLSTSWHLICIFLITPVLASGNIKENSTTVSFLGSILQKVAAVPERPFNLDRVSLMQKIERARDVGLGQPSLAWPETILAVPSEARDLRDPSSIRKNTPRGQLDKEKFMPFGDRHRTIASKIHYKKRKRPKVRFKDVVIDGEARDRIVLYKPDLSKLSVFPSSFSSNSNASIRFKISRHGFVEMPECAVSSGSSEVDQMAIRYIRRWQFVPHGEGLEGGQEGLVWVKFETL